MWLWDLWARAASASIKVVPTMRNPRHFPPSVEQLGPLLRRPAKEHWVGWWIKVTGLPLMYWNYMR
jgi:hypothetical protein